MEQGEPPERTLVPCASEAAAAGDRQRRLTADFAGWLGKKRLEPERFFREGLIVLDANVLLDLYRITPDARRQVLDALGSVADRLWVPHQAAVEFSRNRRQVVEQRMSSFREVKQALRAATANAVDVLESAVAQLERQRERNATTRRWDPSEAGLDRASLLARLDGLMDPALAELETLAAEHDLHPRDMQGGDPLLSQIDDLLAGRIGAAYPPAGLRALVEEVQSFRFPNQVPPGFLDAGKRTPLQAAGDFILWSQTIDRASEMPAGDRLVSLVTGDVKGDWWDLDSRNRPQGPRPELVQELRDSADADLLLLTLKDFLSGAMAYLSSAVSDETLRELQEASRDTAESIPEALFDPSAELDLLSISPLEFEHVVRTMLVRLGYEVISQPSSTGIDFMLTSQSVTGTDVIVAIAKRWRGPIGVSVVQELVGAVFARKAQSGLLVTTGSFTHAAASLA